MLGVCLLFVGIVLINNGMCTLYNVNGKSAAVMNILTGGLSVFINAVNLVQGNYYAAGTGLLFGFTYLFVAFVKLQKLSPIPLCLVLHIRGRQRGGLRNDRGHHGKRRARASPPTGAGPQSGISGAVLWGTSFVEDICGKKLGKFVPVLQVFEGVATAWIPAVSMLIGAW